MNLFHNEIKIDLAFDTVVGTSWKEQCKEGL